MKTLLQNHSNPLRKNSFISNQLSYSVTDVVSNIRTFDGVQGEHGPVEVGDFDGVLRYTNQMLNEEGEKFDDRTFMFHDFLNLQAPEQSFCDALNQEHLPPPSSSRVIVQESPGLVNDGILITQGPSNIPCLDHLRNSEPYPVMDSHLNSFPDSLSGFRFNYETPLLVSQQSSVNGNATYFEQSSFDLGFMNNTYASNIEKTSLNFDSMNKYGSPRIRSSNDHEPADSVLRYINQALLEDNSEERSSVLYDPLTLQAVEKPFYDALGKKYPSSPFNHQIYVDINADRSSGTEENTPGSSKYKVPDERSYPSNGAVRFAVTSSKALVNSRSGYSNERNMQSDSFQSSNMISSIFSDSDSVLLFQKGMEEAMKFLPTNNQLPTDSYKYTLPPKQDVVPRSVGIHLEQGVKDQLPISNRRRKHLYSQDGLQEEPRSRKLSVVYEKEVELSDLFDKVLLYDVVAGSASSRGHVRSPDGINEKLQKKTRSKKRGAKNDDVDLRSLLTSCVRAIASNDRTTAYKKLEQIQKHASPIGDVCQRMANAFGIGIEARLAGNGPEIYAALASRKLSSLEKLKAYEVQCSGCPFRTLGIFFANEMILQVAAKASTLHIVDFGISYGFQWPKLIQELSTRQGGPPKLRITGIEVPQAGFRPTALVEETGQRLAKYCERFNVPFEYQVIATKSWENISVEELKLARNEVLAVTCMFRFRYLFDESVVDDSPRDRVLKLIRKMKPDIFVHSIINGGHHVPLFVNRFREAFFFYSALYDAIDANMSRDHPLRLYFEEELYGSELVNVIGCEGADRVERPETYKSWQTRHIRAGLTVLPLDRELVNKVKARTADGYHKDYEFHEDGNWILQGWKGRILYGTSCWVVK